MAPIANTTRSKHQQLKQIKILAFAPMHNSHGKRDATGAFIPEAKKLVKMSHAESKLVLIDNHLPFKKRADAVMDVLRDDDLPLYDSVAFFCHGWMDGIQFGFKRRNVQDLAESIDVATSGNQIVAVPLFCCSTGDDPDDDPITAVGTGDDSFADKLRDSLCLLGMNLCRVMAHTTVAHTTKNPMVLFMDGMGTPDGGIGGYQPVPKSSMNWTRWKRELRRQNGTLRYRFSYMTVAEIHAELAKPSRRPRSS